MSEPRYMETARREIGLHEIASAVDEPRIVQKFADVGNSWVKDDETAWCAAWLGSHLKLAGYKIPDPANALRALSYDTRIGPAIPIEQARPGDVATFTRTGGGHVGFIVSITKSATGNYTIELLSGNSNNQVRIWPYSADRLVGIVRPERINNVSPVPTPSPVRTDPPRNRAGTDQRGSYVAIGGAVAAFVAIALKVAGCFGGTIPGN